jgi:hypothetical protein
LRAVHHSTVKFNWRPHTQKPPRAKKTAALICIYDAHCPGRRLLLPGIYSCTAHGNWKWKREDNGEPLRHRRYWWLPEEELFQ